MLEVEREQADFARHSRAGRLPSETPGNHEVKDEKQLLLHLERNAFPKPVQIGDEAPFDRGQRWIDRAKQEGRHEPNSLDPLPYDSGSKRVEIKEDVWQLGHAPRSLLRGFAQTGAHVGSASLAQGLSWGVDLIVSK